MVVVAASDRVEYGFDFCSFAMASFDGLG